jgi:hypothetical protein
MKFSMAKSPMFQSRAVLRTIEAGSSAMCTTCDEQVKFKAKVKMQQVICNVYVDGRWDRVEHYHLECYDQSGEPYGTPAPNVPTRASVTTAA